MNESLKIWIVDDERILRVSLADDLRDAGYNIREFSNGNTVLIELKESKPDIIITDIKMPGIDGIELLRKVKEIDKDVQVLIMTAFGSVENAVEAMKQGAYDYILKPFNKEEILITIQKIQELNSFREENKILRAEISKKYDFTSYIGNKKSSDQLFDLIKLISYKDTTVLLTGETGTGKELITNIIHYNSVRKGKPFIKVSCAILSKDIFESELFGHVKGAFTGADTERTGRFELANNGTIYLDDIDDIPLELQVKLLRAIEQREIEKVGSSKAIPINVRIIASTKKDLFLLVKEGKFREDLYYRLNVFPIRLLALRERKYDIPLLINHFLKLYSEGREISVSDDTMKILMEYPWPGNVRELKNISERLAIMATNGNVEMSHLPIEMVQNRNIDLNNAVGNKPLDKILSEIEIASIKCALDRTANNKSKAAEILGIPASTLYTKMEKYKLK